MVLVLSLIIRNVKTQGYLNKYKFTSIKFFTSKVTIIVSTREIWYTINIQSLQVI